MTQSKLTRLISDLSEISLAAHSREEFRQSSMERLAHDVGFDCAAMTHATSVTDFSTDAWGVPSRSLDESLPLYLSEFALVEWQRAMGATTVEDRDMFATARQAKFVC